MRCSIRAPIVHAAAVSAIVLLFGASSAEANFITGSIAFSALGVTDNNANLQDATGFTVGSAFATAVDGTYSGVPLLALPVTFDGFTFNPPVSSVDPLWAFTYDSVAYSFDATSVTASYDHAHHQWDFSGDGMAFATGYSPTFAIWTANISQSGKALGFDATAASVKETAWSGPLLGGAFFILGAAKRKTSGS